MKRFLFAFFLITSFSTVFSQIEVTRAVRVFAPTGIPSEPFLIVQPNQTYFFWLMDTGFNSLGSFSLPLPSEVYYFDILGLSSDFDQDANFEVLFYVYDTFVNVHSYVVLRDIITGLNQLEFNANDSFYTAWTGYFGPERVFVVSDGNTEILYRSGVDVFVDENVEPYPETQAFGMVFDRSLNPSEISFFMTEDGEVSLEVFDISGRAVFNSILGFFRAGNHDLFWLPMDSNGNPLTSGKYIVRIKNNRTTLGESFILLD
ncbi:hypothetical protein JXA84_07165 [candidate division WOR-3 bacterium]|nr:hypothetical protein [candidate division WOR-3 bacterium]